MPLYIEFINKQTQKYTLGSEVDDLLRIALGAEPDEDNYYQDWYMIFALKAAARESGESLSAQRAAYEGIQHERARIIAWLDDNYTVVTGHTPHL